MVSLFYISLCFFLFPLVGEKNDKTNVLGLHPFHIAATEVNHNGKGKLLEISCKFFADDLELTIERNFKTALDITAAKDKALFDKYIPDYISKHLTLNADGKQVKLNYIGYQKDKESVHCFFSVTNIAFLKKLDIADNLLYDLTNDQINMIHVTVNGKRQSTTLTCPATKASFQF